MITRHIVLLIANDLAIAIKNKTIFLILFIPVFVFMSLSLIDPTDTKMQKIQLGLLQNALYEKTVIDSINAANTVFEVTWLNDRQSGITLLKENKLDGMLINKNASLALLVLKKESLHTLAMVESFSALQKGAEAHPAKWITQIESLHTGDIQRQSSPTWILMLILLVGFIIIPAQVAEEKEKQWLLALLQTPIHEVEWLIAKLASGMILIVMALLLLHFFTQLKTTNLFSYIAMILAGSFCFGNLGIFLGLLCRNQASARTLGVIFYLPMLFPAALSDVSQKLTAIASFFPSYQLYMPLQSILLEDSSITSWYCEWIYLMLLGLLMFFGSYQLIKNRWLM